MTKLTTLLGSWARRIAIGMAIFVLRRVLRSLVSEAKKRLQVALDQQGPAAADKVIDGLQDRLTRLVEHLWLLPEETQDRFQRDIETEGNLLQGRLRMQIQSDANQKALEELLDRAVLNVEELLQKLR